MVDQFTTIPGYVGALNVASADVDGDGQADIIVGTAAGTQGRLVVYSGAAVSTGTSSPAKIGGIMTPFGTTFTGGVVVAAGDVTGNGFAEVIVGTQTKGDQVKIYQLAGSTYLQLGSTISQFGTLPSTAQLSLATLDPNGLGVDDIAIGVLSGGIGQVEVIDSNDDPISHVNVGGGLTAMAISSYNASNSGPDSLLIGTIPAGHGTIPHYQSHDRSLCRWV